MNSKQEEVWEGLAQCVHSCDADKPTKPGHFVKTRGLFHPQLSSNEDMVAEDTAGRLCVQEGSTIIHSYRPAA